MASRGLRDSGDGEEPIGDPEEVRATRRRGRRIHLATLAFAALATAALLLPA